MRFRVLGTLEVRSGGDRPSRLGATKQRTLLAVLLLNANRPVEDVALDAGLRVELIRLEERKTAAQEDWIEAQLALGDHESVLAELPVLLAAQPLRETLWAHWMLALYRSGRRADALRAYRD